MLFFVLFIFNFFNLQPTTCNLQFTSSGQFKRFQHLPNIRLTKVEWMLGKCWMNIFNIFKNKENVESMLNESLTQFKFDSTHFQQAFNIFFYRLPTMLNHLFKRPQHLVQQMCWRHVEANVETV